MPAPTSAVHRFGQYRRAHMLIRQDQQFWVVSQLGAREHYGVARALASQGALAALVTEAWACPGSLWSRIAPRLAQRFHPALAQVVVGAWTGQSVIFEAFARGRGLAGWPLMLERNRWFQRRALVALARIAPRLEKTVGPEQQPTLFSYSYTALAQFRWAKARGWRAVLGQIDPGPHDNMLIQQFEPNRAKEEGLTSELSGQYLDDWHEECGLADQIVVNSEWSRKSLLAAGVAGEKLRVIPLAFEAKARPSLALDREHPLLFDAKRPLRVLFLGNLNFRKGALEVFDAVRLIGKLPCEFWFVGPSQIDVPVDIKMRDNVKLIGPVARHSVEEWYVKADVFVFPTHSDGFGLTQLEALSHGLPVIASKNCGEVIKDGVNGFLLDEISGQEIARRIVFLLENTDQLQLMKRRSRVGARYSVSHVGKSFVEI